MKKERIKNAAIFAFKAFCVFGGACLLVFLLCSCRSARGAAGEYIDAVASNQRAAGRAEMAVESLANAVDASRERLGNVARTGEGIASGIERLEYLFGEYEREVDRLLREIERIRAEIEISLEDADAGGGFDNSGGGREDGFGDFENQGED